MTAKIHGRAVPRALPPGGRATGGKPSKLQRDETGTPPCARGASRPRLRAQEIADRAPEAPKPAAAQLQPFGGDRSAPRIE